MEDKNEWLEFSWYNYRNSSYYWAWDWRADIFRKIFDTNIYKEISVSLKNKYLDIKKDYDYIVNTIRDGRAHELSEGEKQHVTETALDNYKKYDYTIFNDKDLENLKHKIVKLIEEVEKWT